MPFERVEAFGPHLPIRLQPRGDVAQWPRREGIDPARTIHPDCHHASLTQYSKVLGNRGLWQGQRVDQAADIASPALWRITFKAVRSPAQVIKNASASVLSHNGEAIHLTNMPLEVYACQGICSIQTD